MALTPLSFLLCRSSHTSSRFSALRILKARPFLSSHPCTCIDRQFSTSSSPILQPDPSPAKYPDPKTTLSSRMSFVFEQIDAIERDRSGKDEALQRIRSWREQKRKAETSASEGVTETNSEWEEKKQVNIFATKEIEVVHPWPEWIELMERLVQQNYFDHRRKDEDGMIPSDPSDDVGGFGFVEEGFDFTRDWTTVRTACLNFGRDRFDILRSLSRKDIQILVGHGCPSVDTKVVFSAKLLRKHAHLDEGDVCSSCTLRTSCSRAYLLVRKEDEARTLDIVRVLLTFGFDPVNGSVENKPLLKLKSVKTVVRKLLHEVVKLSAVPIDPNLPPPVIKRPPPKVKQPPPPPKKRVGRDDIEMKKGDWLCPKCDFMNFAKNTVCLQCDAKRPKRQLLPGEWECPECNFLNYRRNMVCFHCEHKRPLDEFRENQVQAKPNGPRTRLERAVNRPGVSNAWNFDFDDNESDGADVAAFEFADSPRMGEDTPSDGHAYRGYSGGFQDDSFENVRTREIEERGRYSVSNQRTPSFVNGTGFDDFDDEEDDVDSYELDTPNNNSTQESSSKNSRVGGFSESEDIDDSNHYSNTRRGTIAISYDDNPSQPVRAAAFSGSDDGQDFDSDNELSVHPNWKSSHIADTRQKTRGRGGRRPSRGLSFGSDSDDELGLNSDSDNENIGLTSKWNKTERQTSSNRKGQRRGSLDSDDEFLSDSESGGGNCPQSRWNKTSSNRKGQRRGSLDSDDEFLSDSESGGGNRPQSRWNKTSSNRKGQRRGSLDSDVFDSDGDNGPQSRRNNMRGNKPDSDRRGNALRGHDRSGSGRDSRFRSNHKAGHMGNTFGDYNNRERSFGNSRWNSRAPQGDAYGGHRANGRGALQGYDRPAREQGYGYKNHGGGRRMNGRGALQGHDRPAREQGYGYRNHGRFNEFNDRSDRARGPEDNRPRRRIIER